MDPESVLSRLRDRVGGKLLLMSATVQDEEVLNQIYEINPTFVGGEVEFPGKLIHKRLVLKNESATESGRKTRSKNDMEKSETKSSKKRENPALFQSTQQKYLLSEINNVAKENHKEVNGITFSTKMDREADLEEMKSVVLLKCLFFDLGDPLLKTTRKG